MKMMLIPAGDFIMGSSRTETGHTGDEVQKKVAISNPFYIGVYPVTVDLYYGRRTSVPAQTGEHPVANVSWDDAQNFCKQLSAKTGRKVVLPSQAQWEYACRAGSTTAYYFGDDAAKLGDYAWFADNSGNVTHPVGQKKPNAWGLYDMHGNVEQWCSDYLPEWGKGPDDLTTDGWRVREFKVLRGGSYGNHSDACRSASLRTGVHTERSSDRGFRVIVLP
jgi:formylglycine-generating enzyme required for sulfatase activity